MLKNNLKKFEQQSNSNFKEVCQQAASFIAVGEQ